MKRCFDFVVLILLVLFVQCEDDLSLNERNFVQDDVSIPNSDRDVDEGLEYMNGTFYTKGIDGKCEEQTRGGEAEVWLTRTYTINVEHEGEYYFAAHILPVRVPSNLENGGQLQQVGVSVNGIVLGNLKISKADWELAQIEDCPKIRLHSGVNTLVFKTKAPFYPDVDGVRLTDDLQSLLIKNELYDRYIESLQAQNSSSRSAFTEDITWRVSPKVYETPQCDYKHMECVPIAFTYYKKMSLIKGDWTFETGPVQGEAYYDVNPVMYLFKIDDPHKYSFYNDDTNGFHPKITAKNIPAGDYYLVVRSCHNYHAQTTTGREGLVNVFCNGELMNEKMPVSGYVVDVESKKGMVNYFTSNTRGIPTIWIVETDSKKMKFKGGVNFYMDSMDFPWYDDARVYLNKPNDLKYQMLISAEGAMGFYFGNCDVYGSVLDADKSYLNAFPNYKAGDAMQSAKSSNAYNSAAWAGGLDNCWFWGTSTSEATTSNYGSPYVWATWDAYFGNIPNRYNNAPSYSRNNTGRAVIAVWSTTDDMSGVSYFSVTGDANKHAHGYAWETKINGKGRIFHPLNALSGTAAGKVIGYYRKVESRTRADEREMTFEQSVKEGRTVIENVLLDEAQKRLIENRKALSRTISDLDVLYKSWSRRIHSDEFVYTSNPYVFLEVQEGKDLMEYAQNHLEESILYMTQIIFSDKAQETLEVHILPLLFCEILKDTHASLIEEIKEAWRNHDHTESGAYIAPMPITFVKKYIKAILDRDFLHRNVALQ